MRDTFANIELVTWDEKAAGKEKGIKVLELLTGIP